MFDMSFSGESFSSTGYSDTYSTSSIRTPTTTTANYSLSHMLATNKFCTPRTLSTVESMRFDDDEMLQLLPSVCKTNIWSTTSVDHDVNESLFSPFSNTSSSHRLSSYSLGVDFNGMRERKQSVSSTSSPTSPTFMQNQIQNHHHNQNQNQNHHHNQNQFTYSAAARQGLSFVPSRPQLPEVAPFQGYLTFRNYKGAIFTVPKNSKFFVIKSYNILDVTSSFTHNIWTSTELGNRRLDKAFHELKATGKPEYDGKIFLLFSVNSSGKFCGVAEMKENIDFNKSSDIWVEQTRWKGIFPVEWLLIKDVPNRYFQHLKVPSNEFKPVTNSKDTQEVPFEVGISMLKIICSFRTNLQ